jgi:hypothetical protein
MMSDQFWGLMKLFVCLTQSASSPGGVPCTVTHNSLRNNRAMHMYPMSHNLQMTFDNRTFLAGFFTTPAHQYGKQSL